MKKADRSTWLTLVPDVVVRAGRIGGILGRRGGMLGWRRVRGESLACEQWLTETVAELGPAFVKTAQLLSTRLDLLPPKICGALGRLHDNVPPPSATTLAFLRERLGHLDGILVEQSAKPVASGSIACVYRATAHDGRELAIKVRRPGIDRVLDADLILMRGFARLLAWIPPLRGVPVTDIVDQVAGCLRGQLDFAREAANLRELHENLDSESVRVPRAVPHLCTADVLVMEYLDGLDRNIPGTVTAEQRQRAVVLALRAIYRMLFLHGLVHCDLHPGNLYFRTDGSVAIVDAGFTVRLTKFAQTKFTAFFYCMSLGDGDACAEVVMSTATPGPETDVAGFRRELARLVEMHSGARAADFNLVSFAARLFDIQRRYRLYADPQFVFPILSLLVLEGAVRQLHPEVDFQREAMPFLTAAVLKRAATATGTQH